MSRKRKSSNPVVNLLSGGTAGLMEALCCHPLDTIKVRMQIYRKATDTQRAAGVDLAKIKPPGFLRTGYNIFSQEGFLALYKGLGAVVIGIIPKMAIRFSSYEFYRTLLADKTTHKVSTASTFIAGVGAGITEAVIVVNPMDVVKIRLQAQALPKNLASAPAEAAAAAATATASGAKVSAPHYKNAVHCCYTIIKEEGIGALYKGVSLTAARQATNQGANFTVYSKLKEFLQNYHQTETLPSWETSIIGLISGSIGPFTNAPLDTIKTRLQKEKNIPGGKNAGWKRIVEIGVQLVKEEGFRALYKGITPRVMRVAPGQAVTFTVYEFMRRNLESLSIFKKKAETKPKPLN